MLLLHSPVYKMKNKVKQTEQYNDSDIINIQKTWTRTRRTIWRPIKPPKTD